MEALLVTFLSPLLPYLLGVAGLGAKEAVDTFDEKAWSSAKRLWRTLSPRLDGHSRATVSAVAHAPDDEANREALASDLKREFDRDARLRTSVRQLVTALGINDQVIAMSGARSVVVQGSGIGISGNGPFAGTTGHHSPVLSSSPFANVNSPHTSIHGDNPWRGAHGTAFGFLVVGSLIALGGFALFAYSIYDAAKSTSAQNGFPPLTAAGFAIFLGGGVIAAIGGVLNRNHS